MRLSRFFMPVLRETPAEAQIVSHRLMLRAGLVRQEAAGIYAWLPLGFRVLKERHLKLELGLNGHRCNAIHFNGWDGEGPARRIRIAYRLTPDDYRGGDAVQLVVVHREHAARAE